MPIDPSCWNIDARGPHMVVGGCDLVESADQHGTPLFVVNENRLRENCRSVVTALGECDPESGVYFSYKTNSIPGILRMIDDEGLGAEIISEFELNMTKFLGVPPGRVVFDAIYKTDQLLEDLIEHGVRAINIDSRGEIETLDRLAGKHARKIEVGVRLHLRTGWGQNPFGIPLGDMLDVFREIKGKSHLLPTGLHVHTTTRAVSAGDYVAKARKLIGLCELLKRKLGIRIRYIDLGGGYGCATTRKLAKIEQIWDGLFGLDLRPPNVERSVPLAEAVKVLFEEIKNSCAKAGIEVPHVYLEPGRAITADAQFLLARVQTVKRIGGNDVLVTDSGRINMAQPLASEYHEAFVANRMNEPRKRFYKIVGRLCSPGDWLYRKKMLPEVMPGDLLAIMDTGAYFTSLSNSFSFPRPPIISIFNSRTRLLRRGEDFNYLTCLDEQLPPGDE